MKVRSIHWQCAAKFIDSIQEAADVGGAHYAPCFRDCLGDNRDWVKAKLAELIAHREAIAVNGQQTPGK